MYRFLKADQGWIMKAILAATWMSVFDNKQDDLTCGWCLPTPWQLAVEGCWTQQIATRHWSSKGGKSSRRACPCLWREELQPTQWQGQPSLNFHPRSWPMDKEAVRQPGCDRKYNICIDSFPDHYLHIHTQTQDTHIYTYCAFILYQLYHTIFISYMFRISFAIAHTHIYIYIWIYYV